MKLCLKVALIALSTLYSSALYAQMRAIEKLSEIKDIQYHHVDREAITEALNNNLDISFGDTTIIGGKDSDDILKEVDELYVLTAEAKSAAKKLSKGAQKILKGKEFKSLININGDENGTVQICTAEQQGKNVLALLVNSDEGEVVFVVIKGSLNLSKLVERIGSNLF